MTNSGLGDEGGGRSGENCLFRTTRVLTDADIEASISFPFEEKGK